MTNKKKLMCHLFSCVSWRQKQPIFARSIMGGAISQHHFFQIPIVFQCFVLLTGFWGQGICFENPMGVSTKVATTSPRRFSFSAEYFRSIKNYTIIETADDPFQGFAVGDFTQLTTVRTGNKEIFNFSIGVQKKLFDGRANLKVSVSDIFKTPNFNGVANFGPLFMDINGGWDRRRLRVNFSYLIGNSQVKAARRRNTSQDEEQRRAKSGGN